MGWPKQSTAWVFGRSRDTCEPETALGYGLNFMKTADKGGRVIGSECSRPF
jgi:hypothetical protein